MIIQALLNWLSDVIAGLVGQFPPLPIEWNQALAMVAGGGDWLGVHMAKFGVIVPWDAFGTVITLWLGILAFWGICQAIRVVVWALGR